MPSRQLSPSAGHAHKVRVLVLAIAGAGAILVGVAVVIVILICVRRRSSRRASATLPLSPPPLLRRFRQRELRAATAAFHPSRLLGRGSSAAVYRGILADGKSIAVKLLHSSSFQDHSFNNELQILGSLRPSPYVVSLLGYSLDSRRNRLLLVYEYMPSGSLQEALFGSSVLPWDYRFSILLDVARALSFLHLECDPPVIHGDIKPSNVLLGVDFQAKISDFGLARFKLEGDYAPELFSQELGPSQELSKSQDLANVSNGHASPSVDFAFAVRPSSSSSCKSPNVGRSSPSVGRLNDNDMAGIGDEKGKEAATVVPCDDEINAGEHSKELGSGKWWWKQDRGGELSSKDYVREWIGSQTCLASNPDWDEERRSPNLSRAEKSENGAHENKKRKKMREWWKEEPFTEMNNESKNSGKGMRSMNWFLTGSRHGQECSNLEMNDSRRGMELDLDISFKKGWKKKRNRSMGSNGDPFSRELSSNASMRGTIFYMAPEYDVCGHMMEKTDVYSFGVLMLVIISGRRPLHVVSSPIKLEKANLLCWCKQLARIGNVLELVDKRLKNLYDKEQAALCINLALLCLQRSPELRPDSGDIVKILTGEMELPVVPVEHSPSPGSRLFSRSRRKNTPDE